MAIMTWDPWREIEDLFDRYTRAGGSQNQLTTTGDVARNWAPRVDIAETSKEFLIKAEIPEVKKEDVKVNLENGVLTISGERKQEKEESGKRFHRVERQYGSFTRSFTLPDNVDQSKVEATFKDGMLNIAIEKTEAARPKKIEIKVK
ncbi:Hsp20/alpha crystallin family protein [Geopsychrobacter electrodiphilus]|uniref:Hsp20/alpha crystallin family protein n=1 Tax=Geopsychrobacter electrodiphilus TaxID=225196 RepID=UPI000382185B|nr:Hsp20/alpha crystallin family protein [Geopsychrobacter electrodiphilus]